MNFHRTGEVIRSLDGFVAVATASTPNGLAGFAASTVLEASERPFSLLVCIDVVEQPNAFLDVGSRVCLNFFRRTQRADFSTFRSVSLSMKERFAATEWTFGQAGIPELDGAALHVECRVLTMKQLYRLIALECLVSPADPDDLGSYDEWTA
nr:flavin reductase [Paraburkholderia bannensis]